MNYNWIPFFITVGILLGILHGLMIDLPNTMNCIGATLFCAAIFEAFVRLLVEIKKK